MGLHIMDEAAVICTYIALFVFDTRHDVQCICGLWLEIHLGACFLSVQNITFLNQIEFMEPMGQKHNLFEPGRVYGAHRPKLGTS